MYHAPMSNLWERQQNKRAKMKKERAKKHFSSPDEVSFWKEEEQIESHEVGVLVSIHRTRCEVLLNDVPYSAMLARGIDPRAVNDLAVGDRVWLERGEDGSLSIVRREDRESWIIRPRGDWTRASAAAEDHVLAANVDIGIITMSVKDPDFHPRFVDRYLALLQMGKVTPLVCLTKSELSSERHPILSYYRESGILVLETSVARSEGIEALKSALHGKTAVFLGQSGVGKSSLISTIIPEREITVGSVNEKTGKGKHTTTVSELFKWDTDSYIIDTPGIRSLGIEQIPKNEIRFLFPEFQEVDEACRFSDCLHMNEPDCAIKQALDRENSPVNRYRYESYVKMMEE